jgi:hypothetical protein
MTNQTNMSHSIAEPSPGHGELDGATLRSRWGRFPLLAHFPPKHHCQSSGHYCSEHAYPQRNNHAIQGDFPTPKKSEDVRDGNQPKNNSGDKGERLHICPSLKADEARRLFDAGEIDATPNRFSRSWLRIVE